MYAFFQLPDARAFQGRGHEHWIANSLVEIFQRRERVRQLLVIEVRLVEDDTGRYMVGFGGDEQAVDEAGRSARQRQRRDYAELVDVRGYDVSLLGELGGFADDVVAAVEHVVYHAGSVVLKQEFHLVAHGHGVGLFVASQTVVASQTAVERGSVGKHLIPTTRGACYQALHLILLSRGRW